MTSLNGHEPTFRQRIEAVRQTKVEHNLIKLKTWGYHDIDDHGIIPWPDPISFQAKPNHPSGVVYGPKAIGENFYNFLDVHPVYIHPQSALAGAWAAYVSWIGWPPEDRPEHLYALHKKYKNYCYGIGGMNHLGPDMKIGLDLGWGGLLQKIRYHRDLNRPPDTSFYDGEEAFVLGMQNWIRKHVVKAREMAAAETNPVIRENLLQIAAMNEYLVDGAPRTLREACQFLAWFQSVDRMYAAGGALGQLDELLRPFYEADKAAGIITDDEEVVWYLASLFFNDTHYSQIGGPAPDGHDVTSTMSFLILEAMHQLRIPINMALRVHEGLSPALLRRAVYYLYEDGSGVSYSCADGLDTGYARNGVPIQLARMRAKVGCNWTALPGIEYCLQDVTRISMVQPLLFALQELLADKDAPRTMEALWERYVPHMASNVKLTKDGFDWHFRHQAKNAPEIVLNLFCHGTIERGLDVAGGGVDIYRMSIDGLGLATVADSFAAIEQRVVNEKRLTWEELADCIANDYEGTEKIRLMLKNIPRFGTGGSRADWWAKRVADLFTHLVRDTPTDDGYAVIPGLFSHGDTGNQAKVLNSATPNGRRKSENTSHSANPDPGFMPGGVSAPTAKATAVAAVQPGWGNSAPLQLDFDKAMAKDMGGLEAVESIIKTHNAQGGTLININVYSKEQILAAHADPEKYPDLLVRVTGYSAFFRSLSREYRQQIVDRFLAE